MRIDVAGIASEEKAKLLDEGTHELQIGTTKVAPTKKDPAKLMLTLPVKAVDNEYALCDTVWDTIILPMRIDDLWPEDQKIKTAQMNRMSRLKLQQLFQSAGVDYDDTGFDPDDLNGKVVKAVVRHGTDQNGLPRAEIKAYLS